MWSMSLYSVKMRASRDGAHTSGAERIVKAAEVADVVAKLTQRALTHPNGAPDQLTVTVAELAGEIRRVPALRVVEDTADFLPRFFAEHGFHPRALELLRTVTGLRGAMLIDADTGHRLDSDTARGVRVTNMDHAQTQVLPTKQHFAEAMALAAKVASHPNIVAELCISDDPDYTTGYVAHAGTYYRLAGCKETGERIGTRVFLYDGPLEEVAQTIDYLENTPVLVEGL